MPDHQQTQQSKKSDSTFQKQAIPTSQMHVSHPASIIQRARINPKSLTAADVLQLQRTIGNRAVGRLLSEIRNPPTVQQVPIQRQEIPEEEESLQGKFETIQRLEPEEEEKLQMKPIVQRQEIPEEEEPLQKKSENNTGMPDNLKAGVENLSGIDMSDVRVHYNSSKPAEVGALAYTQGTNIHVAPGQEKHLPHEAWHVVQQAQGKVKPTMQLKGVAVNDDAGLEREAEVMGQRSTFRLNSINSYPCKQNDSYKNIACLGDGSVKKDSNSCEVVYQMMKFSELNYKQQAEFVSIDQMYNLSKKELSKRYLSKKDLSEKERELKNFMTEIAPLKLLTLSPNFKDFLSRILQSMASSNRIVQQLQKHKEKQPTGENKELLPELSGNVSAVEGQTLESTKLTTAATESVETVPKRKLEPFLPSALESTAAATESVEPVPKRRSETSLPPASDERQASRSALEPTTATTTTTVDEKQVERFETDLLESQNFRIIFSAYEMYSQLMGITDEKKLEYFKLGTKKVPEEEMVEKSTTKFLIYKELIELHKTGRPAPNQITTIVRIGSIIETITYQKVEEKRYGRDKMQRIFREDQPHDRDWKSRTNIRRGAKPEDVKTDVKSKSNEHDAEMYIIDYVDQLLSKYGKESQPQQSQPQQTEFVITLIGPAGTCSACKDGLRRKFAQWSQNYKMFKFKLVIRYTGPMFQSEGGYDGTEVVRTLGFTEEEGAKEQTSITIGSQKIPVIPHNKVKFV